jgi:hypothetical protein
MAHFAELDNNNIVKQVIVVSNNELLDEHGNEIEQKGIDFCQSLFGIDTRWVQTSYNSNFRKCYAGIGFKYDSNFDSFISPQPYPSWKLNYTTYEWEAPVARPDKVEGYLWKWSEYNKEWIKIAEPTE